MCFLADFTLDKLDQLFKGIDLRSCAFDDAPFEKVRRIAMMGKCAEAGLNHITDKNRLEFRLAATNQWQSRQKARKLGKAGEETISLAKDNAGTQNGGCRIDF